MNKKDFIEKLMKQTGYDEEKCSIVNDILESHFLIGKNQKEKIITDFIEKLSIDRKESNELYNNCVSILSSGLKEKIRHPFKSKD